MYSITISYKKNNQPDSIGIKCQNYKKEIGHTIQKKLFRKFITPFFVNIVFQHVGIACIVYYNYNLKFDVQELHPSCMCGGQ